MKSSTPDRTLLSKQTTLPRTPLQQAPSRSHPSRSRAACAILTWTFFAITLLLYNKLVLDGMNFRFPMFVTMLHCFGVSASLYVASSWFLLFKPPQQMDSFGSLVRKMIPIALVFAAATVMRNYALVSLSIPMIQMINSSSPALVYVLSCVAKLDRFSVKMGAAVGGISAGVFLSAAFMLQSASVSSGAALLFAGLALEAIRGILLKKMLNASCATESVSPLGLLYVSSTMSFFFLVGPVALTEAKEAISALRASPVPLLFPLLTGNVCFAICLNFASFNFIKTCSVTTTSITAVLKDCALFFASFMFAQKAKTSSSLHGRAFLEILNIGVAGYVLSFVSTIVYVRLRCESTSSRDSGDCLNAKKGCTVP